MPAEACARGIARSIEKNRSESLIGGREMVAAYTKRFAPKLLERSLERVKIR
jgi:hypothetical protein